MNSKCTLRTIVDIKRINYLFSIILERQCCQINNKYEMHHLYDRTVFKESSTISRITGYYTNSGLNLT